MNDTKYRLHQICRLIKVSGRYLFWLRRINFCIDFIENPRLSLVVCFLRLLGIRLKGGLGITIKQVVCVRVETIVLKQKLQQESHSWITKFGPITAEQNRETLLLISTVLICWSVDEQLNTFQFYKTYRSILYQLKLKVKPLISVFFSGLFHIPYHTIHKALAKEIKQNDTLKNWK